MELTYLFIGVCVGHETFSDHIKKAYPLPFPN